jgi:hypothetical protein
LASLRAGGADKNFENFSAEALPNFTDPPNRLFDRTLGVLERIAALEISFWDLARLLVSDDRTANSANDPYEFWIILVKRAEAGCRIDE